MNRVEEKCRVLWFKSVHTRDKVCQVCGVGYSTQAHHLFGRDNWPVAYNVKFGVGLCPKHHREFEAPADLREKVWDRFIRRLEIIDPDRAALILKTRESPPPIVHNPDWESILEWVTGQYNEIVEQAAYTDDIEPSYGRTII